MEVESGITKRIIDELHSLEFKGDQTEGDSGFTQNIIDELSSWDIQRD